MRSFASELCARAPTAVAPHEKFDTQGSRKRGERAREREERDSFFKKNLSFIFFSHCSSVMQRGQKTPSFSDQMLGSRHCTGERERERERARGRERA